MRIVLNRMQQFWFTPLSARWRRSRAAGSLDQMAITLSGLCLVHCVLTALLVAMLASTGSALLSPVFHEFGLAMAIIFGALSLGPGLLRPDDRLPGMIGLAGIALMATGLVMSIVFGTHNGELLFTLLGVATVALAHGLNYSPHCPDTH